MAEAGESRDTRPIWQRRTVNPIVGLGAAAVLSVVGGKAINQQVSHVLHPQNPDAIKTYEPQDSNGVRIEVINEAKTHYPNSQAEMQVYRQFADQRMFSLLRLDKLSEKDHETLSREVQAMRKVIQGNPSFEGMKSVTKNHAQDIIAAANKYKIPPEILLSISLIENGGGENMVSPSGAKGYMQLAPDKSPDNGPGDAEKAAIYLVDMRDRFGGDLGIAVWGYHAGEGNVYHALQVYFNDTRGTKFGDITEMSEAAAAKMASTYKQLISDYKVNLFTLFSNKEVQKQALANLEDETELYTWKVIAANMIINEQLPGIISKVLATDQKPIVQFPR